MTNLSKIEQQAVAEIKAIYGQLSAEAKGEAAKTVSWAEKHFWPTVIITFSAGALLGGFVVGAFVK